MQSRWWLCIPTQSKIKKLQILGYVVRFCLVKILFLDIGLMALPSNLYQKNLNNTKPQYIQIFSNFFFFDWVGIHNCMLCIPTQSKKKKARIFGCIAVSFC